MIPRIVDMKYVAEYRVWLRFDDGASGEIDLRDELWGDVFEPLRNLEAFKSVHLNQELSTIQWDNGADFAHEFLHERVKEGATPQPL